MNANLIGNASISKDLTTENKYTRLGRMRIIDMIFGTLSALFYFLCPGTLYLSTL